MKVGDISNSLSLFDIIIHATDSLRVQCERGCCGQPRTHSTSCSSARRECRHRGGDILNTHSMMAVASWIDEQALLNDGASVDVRDGNGMTSLFYASMYGKLKVAKVSVYAFLLCLRRILSGSSVFGGIRNSPRQGWTYCRRCCVRQVPRIFRRNMSSSRRTLVSASRLRQISPAPTTNPYLFMSPY